MQYSDVADAHRHQSCPGSREEPPLAVLAEAFQRARGIRGGINPVGQLEPVDPHASPERSLLARERLAHVSAAVDNLPNQQRAVFVLRFLEEMSIEEIAQATSLRPGTVKAHLFRAVSAVRERVKERKNR
jgi:RNA polymerase sigma factor (sigma-70 family)